MDVCEILYIQKLVIVGRLVKDRATITIFTTADDETRWPWSNVKVVGTAKDFILATQGLTLKHCDLGQAFSVDSGIVHRLTSQGQEIAICEEDLGLPHLIIDLVGQVVTTSSVISNILATLGDLLKTFNKQEGSHASPSLASASSEVKEVITDEGAAGNHEMVDKDKLPTPTPSVSTMGYGNLSPSQLRATIDSAGEGDVLHTGNKLVIVSGERGVPKTELGDLVWSLCDTVDQSLGLWGQASLQSVFDVIRRHWDVQPNILSPGIPHLDVQDAFIQAHPDLSPSPYMPDTLSDPTNNDDTQVQGMPVSILSSPVTLTDLA